MRREAIVGAAFALLAFGSWGINPLYFKAVAQVAVTEVEEVTSSATTVD